jgi:hypothetical protein
MSKLETNTIDTVSGTSNLTIGGANNTGSTTIKTNNTDAVTIDNSQNLKFNSGFGSVATAYGCRAWVNFNGTGTVAIRDSGNVSSITDNGSGHYTINFTTTLPDTNYCMVSGPSHDNNTDGAAFSVRSHNGTISTSSIEILTAYANANNNGVLDMATIGVAILR